MTLVVWAALAGILLVAFWLGDLLAEVAGLVCLAAILIKFI